MMLAVSKSILVATGECRFSTGFEHGLYISLWQERSRGKAEHILHFTSTSMPCLPILLYLVVNPRAPGDRKLNIGKAGKNSPPKKSTAITKKGKRATWTGFSRLAAGRKHKRAKMSTRPAAPMRILIKHDRQALWISQILPSVRRCPTRRRPRRRRCRNQNPPPSRRASFRV